MSRSRNTLCLSFLCLLLFSFPALATNAPTNLAAATSAGNTILVWKAPLIADPDVGDSIDHYVIYRDGVAFADRFDRGPEARRQHPVGRLTGSGRPPVSHIV